MVISEHRLTLTNINITRVSLTPTKIWLKEDEVSLTPMSSEHIACFTAFLDQCSLESKLLMKSHTYLMRAGVWNCCSLQTKCCRHDNDTHFDDVNGNASTTLFSLVTGLWARRHVIMHEYWWPVFEKCRQSPQQVGKHRASDTFYDFGAI